MANNYTDDHDILIELRTEFRGFREEVRGALSSYSSLNKRVSDIERLSPREKLKEHDEVYDWMKTVRGNWKFILALVSVLGAVFGGLAALVEILYYGSHIK